MSTRCAIIAEKEDYFNPGNPNNGLRRVAWYRHCDGYPSSTGFDLIQKVAEALPALYREREKFSIRDVQYRLEDRLPVGDYERLQPEDLPGDLEYLYVLQFSKERITIVCHSRKAGGGFNNHDEPETWPSTILACWH
jgi:hypothetical protein